MTTNLASKDFGVAVLDGLGEVSGGDVFLAVQVCDGACDAKYAVMAAGSEAHAFKGGTEDFFTGGVQFAEAANHSGQHVGVTAGLGAGEAVGLDGAGGVHAGFDSGGRLWGFTAAHGLEFDGGDFDVEVHAVQHGA